MKAMILAAGFGSRLRPLTATTPKPLIPVGGKPLIVHHIENLHRAGVDDIVINVSHLADKITDALGNGRALGVNITYSREEVPLQTGGGIKKALPVLGDAPFVLVNADAYTEYPLARLADEAASFSDRLAHLVLVDNPPHNPSGDYGLGEPEQGLAPLRSHCETCYTYSGLGVISPDLFAGETRQTFGLSPLVRQAAVDGRVTAEHFSGYWQDVGTLERLEDLRARLDSQTPGA